jgi:hypothetical protein
VTQSYWLSYKKKHSTTKNKKAISILKLMKTKKLILSFTGEFKALENQDFCALSNKTYFNQFYQRVTSLNRSLFNQLLIIRE